MKNSTRRKKPGWEKVVPSSFLKRDIMLPFLERVLFAPPKF